jgi:hypothetical protein
MSAGGVMPCGSSRLLRLDPFALPIQFRASDAAADERVRFIEIHRKRVVMRRSLAGMRMAISLPVSCFLGVALRIIPPNAASEGAVAIVLEHSDAALAIPLFTAPDGKDAVAEWRAWGRVLGLPLLVADADGLLREPFRRIGALSVAGPLGRRRRGSALKRRKPRILARRRSARLPAPPRIHRDEWEIIARS